jgi:hypothetical protein
MSQKVDEQKCLAQFVASLASTTRWWKKKLRRREKTSRPSK